MIKVSLRTTYLVVASTTALLASLPVLAQESKDVAQMEARFKAADKNGDGKLTLEEAKAGMPKIAARFDKIDKDKKGYVTVDDIKAAMGGK